MEQLPFFSIIIPTLNEEEYVPHLLTDIKKQKEKNFEVIVVDGLSQDHTKEKATEFRKFFPLQFYTNEKKNVSFQRNFGAKAAIGKYLVFLDADSRISKSFTKKLGQFIQKKRGLVLIPYISPDENTSQNFIIFKITNFLLEFAQNIGKPFSAGGNMIWEKDFFFTVGGFDETLYLSEDHNIIQEAFRWGVKAKLLPNIKVKFSLRRMRREGQLAMLYKFLISTGHILLKGDIKKKIFEYEMGGKVLNTGRSFLPFEQNFKKYFQQLKQFFKQYLT